MDHIINQDIIDFYHNLLYIEPKNERIVINTHSTFITNDFIPENPKKIKIKIIKSEGKIYDLIEKSIEENKNSPSWLS